jgi:hypothetical protein
MEMDATAGIFPAPQTTSLRHIGRSLLRIAGSIAVAASLISLLLLAWIVNRDAPYSSSSDLGYWLGICGGSLMLVLLIYPLRKRFRALAFLGPLKHWFRFHMFAGVAGPVIVLFHSTFRVGSFNAAIALASMLLVVASGIVGRVLYRKIHHGLYGSRATVAELQRTLEQQMASLKDALTALPAIEQEVRRFAVLATRQPTGRWRHAMHFILLGGERLLAGYRLRRAIAGSGLKVGADATATTAHLNALMRTLDELLGAMQRTTQFSTYETLFSLWHVVHIPFLCMLVVTAIVHVVAVHAY